MECCTTATQLSVLVRRRDAGRPSARIPPGPVVEEVPEPTIAGPLDMIVKIGGAGVCRTDLHIMAILVPWPVCATDGA